MKEMFAAYAPNYGSVGLAKVVIIGETDKSYLTSGGIPAETLVGWVGYVPKRVNKESGTSDIRLFHSGPEATQYLIDRADKTVRQLRERIHRIESDIGPLRKILRNVA